MKTDSLFYELFKLHPASLFELAGHLRTQLAQSSQVFADMDSGSFHGSNFALSRTSVAADDCAPA